MLFTAHLCTGAVLGRLLPAPAAAAAGVASHLAMDAVPHWGSPDPLLFLRVARVDGLLALAVAGILLAGAPRQHRIATAAGIAGAGLLDLDKPFMHFFGFSPFPAAVDAVHARVQQGREAPARWPVDALTGTVALVYLGGRYGLFQPDGVRRVLARLTAAARRFHHVQA